MITSEISYCVYCRGFLLTQDEIDLQYHVSCRNEYELFNPKLTDLEILNAEEVEKFQKKWQKRNDMLEISFVLDTCLMFIFVIFMLSDLIGAITGIFACLLIVVIISYPSFRISNLINFCNLSINLKPDYLNLSFKYSVALIGKIYLVNYSKISFSNGLYIIKFLEDVENKESRKIKLPSFPFSKAFQNEYFSIKFARIIKKVQIRFNSKTVKSGLASIYCVHYDEVRGDYWDINRMIFSMNRENFNFK